MSRLRRAAGGALVAGAVCLGLAHPAAAGSLVWKVQLGTQFSDIASDVAVDPGGNVWVPVYVDLNAEDPGQIAGMIVGKFSPSGENIAAQQFPVYGYSHPGRIAADSQGNVWVVGDVNGAFFGPEIGDYDAWLIKFDENANAIAINQFGTPFKDFVSAVATDPDDNVLVTGRFLNESSGRDSDVWVAKLDSSGTQLWRRQFGTTKYDSPAGVATDASDNVYVAGSTDGPLAGTLRGPRDAFLIKFDSAGHQLWRRQVGTVDVDEGHAVATDGDGNVYLAGSTVGNIAGPNKGPTDGWVLKFDSAGNKLWRRQIGTIVPDSDVHAANDGFGNVIVTGSTAGSLGGANKGKADVFGIKLSATGQVAWRWQRGTSGDDVPTAVAADGSGAAYIVGASDGPFAGPFGGGTTDGWIVKVNTVTNAAP